MLVTFESTTSGAITLFGDVAIRLLKMMGHSGTVPSAIAPEDTPEALQRLEAAIAAEEAVDLDEVATEVDDEEEGQFVSLRNRAFPLIMLLEAAAKENASVMWHDETPGD